MDKISIIVPYYNSNLFLLRKCISSILKQSYKNFELIIVIDGSKEQYTQVKDYYESKDSRVHFYVIDHSGVSVARNFGLEKSTGEYIAFIDSDDFVDEIFLEELYQNIQGYDLAICGVTEQFFPTADAKLNMKIFQSLPAEYNYLQYTNFSVNKLYRKQIINNNRLHFEKGIKLGEDALFLAEYYKYCNNISITSKPLYHYVPNPTSSTKKYEKDYWKWERKVIAVQWNFFNTYPLTDREKSYNYSWLFHKYNGIFNYYFMNDIENGIQYIHEIMNEKLFLDLLNNTLLLDEFWNKDMSEILSSWKKIGIKYYKLRRIKQFLRAKMSSKSQLSHNED